MAKHCKRYFIEYESDVVFCGKNTHTWGNASSISSAKASIRSARKKIAHQNPRNFKVYDSWSDELIDDFVPCVYSEV